MYTKNIEPQKWPQSKFVFFYINNFLLSSYCNALLLSISETIRSSANTTLALTAGESSVISIIKCWLYLSGFDSLCHAAQTLARSLTLENVHCNNLGTVVDSCFQLTQRSKEID